VAATKDKILRVFATKPFMRFAESFGANTETLWACVQNECDADLGGGVFKYRLARAGEGSSGGGRAIVAMRAGERVVMMFGFEKKDLPNIKRDELREFRKAAKVYLSITENQVADLLKIKTLVEIKEPLKS
jgi:hypothetical protein